MKKKSRGLWCGRRESKPARSRQDFCVPLSSSGNWFCRLVSFTAVLCGLGGKGLGKIELYPKRFILVRGTAPWNDVCWEFPLRILLKWDNQGPRSHLLAQEVGASCLLKTEVKAEALLFCAPDPVFGSGYLRPTPWR